MTKTTSQTLLKITGLQVAYGGIKAVKGVDLHVNEGELVTLIGSNGAGKTTTMKAITGSLPMADGDIEYLGKSIKGKGAWDLVREGLAVDGAVTHHGGQNFRSRTRCVCARRHDFAG